MMSSTVIHAPPAVLLVDASRNAAGWESELCERLLTTMARRNIRLIDRAPVRVGAPDDLAADAGALEAATCILLIGHGAETAPGPDAEVRGYWEWLVANVAGPKLIAIRRKAPDGVAGDIGEQGPFGLAADGVALLEAADAPRAVVGASPLQCPPAKPLDAAIFGGLADPVELNVSPQERRTVCVAFDRDRGDVPVEPIEGDGGAQQLTKCRDERGCVPRGERSGRRPLDPHAEMVVGRHRIVGPERRAAKAGRQQITEVDRGVVAFDQAREPLAELVEPAFDGGGVRLAGPGVAIGGGELHRVVDRRVGRPRKREPIEVGGEQRQG